MDACKQRINSMVNRNTEIAITKVKLVKSKIRKRFSRQADTANFFVRY